VLSDHTLDSCREKLPISVPASGIRPYLPLGSVLTHGQGCPISRALLREMWDLTALNLKLPALNENIRAFSLLVSTGQLRLARLFLKKRRTLLLFPVQSRSENALGFVESHISQKTDPPSSVVRANPKSASASGGGSRQDDWHRGRRGPTRILDSHSESLGRDIGGNLRQHQGRRACCIGVE
jgi:hypothetical protein